MTGPGSLSLPSGTRLRVIGGYTGEDLKPARDADWIVIRRYMLSGKERAVRNYLAQVLRSHPYREINLGVMDTPWENRESPKQHYYRTQLKGRPLRLFQRIE